MSSRPYVWCGVVVWWVVVLRGLYCMLLRQLLPLPPLPCYCQPTCCSACYCPPPTPPATACPPVAPPATAPPLPATACPPVAPPAASPLPAMLPPPTASHAHLLLGQLLLSPHLFYQAALLVKLTNHVLPAAGSSRAGVRAAGSSRAGVRAAGSSRAGGRGQGSREQQGRDQGATGSSRQMGREVGTKV